MPCDPDTQSQQEPHMTPSQTPACALGLVVLWGILGLTASGSWAVDNEQSREVLRGLPGLGVLVERLNPDAEHAGLTETQIQTDVELRLRQAGIAVLTEGERLRTPSMPVLYVRVSTYKRGEIGVFAYNISVELLQFVLIEHNSTHVTTTTWSTGALGIVGEQNLSLIRASIRDYVDRFINAYLAVNPRPAGSATPLPVSPRKR
jgi:hypothetical protein